MSSPQTPIGLKQGGTGAAIRPAAVDSGTTLVRSALKIPNGPLQFWRLSRGLELRRSHGRLLIHGNGYWK